MSIVGDGMIAMPNVGEGRMFPVVILDTLERPDIDHLVEAHKYLPPGDVKTQWGSPSHLKDHVCLSMEFLRPVLCEVVVNFDILSQGALVDATVTAGALYLQPGVPGARVAGNIGAPKVLVEVVTAGFDKIWNKMYRRVLERHLRDRGLGKRDAKQAATEAVREMRAITSRRVAGNTPTVAGPAATLPNGER